MNIQNYSNKLCNRCMKISYHIPFYIIKNFYEHKIINGGNINYYNKYIKYKTKYLNLKNIY
jgi:hypothetical protein